MILNKYDLLRIIENQLPEQTSRPSEGHVRQEAGWHLKKICTLYAQFLDQQQSSSQRHAKVDPLDVVLACLDALKADDGQTAAER